MIKRLAPSTLPAVTAAGSFLAIVVLVMSTNPSQKIAYAMFFFLAFMLFLISLGHLLVGRFKGQVTPLNRYRIFIISIFLTVLLMFRSAQTLGWMESFVLFALTLGLLFYSGRRA